MKQLIALLLIGFLIWYFFIRGREKKPPISPQDEELMVQCCKCGTYVSSKECIVDKGEHFCSKECLEHRKSE